LAAIEVVMASDGALLEIEALSCRFGGLEALADLGFSVREGEIKAIIGPNGAGKTTLFNLIGGVIVPSGGRIRLDGKAIHRLPPFRRAQLGVIRTFQNLGIFSDMTVLENVMVGCHSRSHSGTFQALWRSPRSAAEEADIRLTSLRLLERVGLSHRAGEAATALSFGERKLLEIARALAAAPRLLMLDEPAAGVSHEAAAGIAATIRELNRDGLTVLLVEHNMNLVMNVSHSVLVLDHGRKIAEGRPEEIRRDPAVLAAYLGYDEDA
jgi:branched-chain amino acid transport system ATP-binding protein